MIIPPQELFVCPLESTTLIRNTSSRSGNADLLVRKFVTLLLVALVLAVSTASGANRGKIITSHKVSRASASVTISLSEYGAVGDGVTDDGPALQNALDALASAGGGTLFVPGGRYAIATPVAVDFANRANAIVIQGPPSSSPHDATGDPGQGLNLTAEFLIKTGETNDALALRGLATFSVENLIFLGDLAVANDARVVLRLSAINSSTIDTCEFYGLGSFVADGAIVYDEGGELKISDSAFLGCGGNSGTFASIVQVYDWTGLSITGTRFVDYGNRPDFYSKTTIMSPFSWISVGGAASLTNLSPRRDVIIRDVLLDEGAYYALSVRPGLFPVAHGGAISSVYLSNLYVNVTNLGEVGVRIHYVDNVFIEHSHFGWSHNTRGAMQLANVKNAILNQIECVDSANTIIADDTVGELSVVNSVYETLNSQAPVTRVITTPDPQDGPAEYVKQKYLDILSQKPDIPSYVYWSQRRARCVEDSPCPANEDLLRYLNGNPAQSFSLDGRLMDTDGLPVASATVSLSGTHSVNTLTDENGYYTFAGLATSGDYTITPSKAFYTFSNNEGPSGSFIAPTGNQTADFIGTLAKYSIRGRVNDSNMQSMSGVSVTLHGGPADFEPRSQATTGTGDYSFTDLPAGYSYALNASTDFYAFGPGVQLLLADNTLNVNFVGTPFTHTITGSLIDESGPLADATVTVSGDADRSTTSDASGLFSIEGLVSGGNYMVRVSKRHYSFTNQAITNLPDDLTLTFVGQRLRYAITGAVTIGANGLAGVTVTLGGDQPETVVTNSTGSYAFTVNAGGTYTITASKPGYAFAPSSFVFNDLDQNVYPSFAGTFGPVLMTEAGSERAIAFNSITMFSEPFDLFTTPFDFGPDRRTRVSLFARLVSQVSTSITATGEDSQGHVYALVVEFAGPLPDAPGITQINVKLDSQLATGGDVRIRIVVDGLASNNVLVRIN